MSAFAPDLVLFTNAAESPTLPVCDHYAGSERLMRKSLQRQMASGPSFDITFDCEDGAQVGQEQAHAELVARLLASEENRFSRVGVRIHAPSHPGWRRDLDIIVGQGARLPAYVMVPKVQSVAQVETVAQHLRELGAETVPLHVLIETHGALEAVHAIAALPLVQSLSFGLMDFVSAHGGAIPDAAMRSPGQFDHPLVRRAKLEISAACHAHGKVPSHNVSTEVRDMSVVADDARRARDEFGFTRMWSIHPEQIEPIVSALSPAPALLDTATRILLAALANNWGPIRHADRLHDRASYRYYWSLLKRAHAMRRELPAAARALFEDIAPPSASRPATAGNGNF